MDILVTTAVLWTTIWGTKPGSIESIAKDLLKSLITVDIRSGKKSYTKDEILELLEYCYKRAGSKTPANKAKLTWSNFARPEKEGWFVKVA